MERWYKVADRKGKKYERDVTFDVDFFSCLIVSYVMFFVFHRRAAAPYRREARPTAAK